MLYSFYREFLANEGRSVTTSTKPVRISVGTFHNFFHKSSDPPSRFVNFCKLMCYKLINLSIIGYLSILLISDNNSFKPIPVNGKLCHIHEWFNYWFIMGWFRSCESGDTMCGRKRNWRILKIPVAIGRQGETAIIIM